MTLRLLVALGAALLLPATAHAQRKGADTATVARKVDLTPRTRGAATAPIVVYEMSDFQCPYCRRFAVQTFPELERDYIATGKVRWVFINLPLTQLHDNAASAAALAVCSGRQGKFWEVHDLLFRNQATWAPLREPASYFYALADSAGVDRAALQRCVTAPETEDEVEQDAVSAVRAGANSTPTFYIEGGLLPGAQPAPVFRQILDSIYAAKTAKAK